MTEATDSMFIFLDVLILIAIVVIVLWLKVLFGPVSPKKPISQAQTRKIIFQTRTVLQNFRTLQITQFN